MNSCGSVSFSTHSGGACRRALSARFHSPRKAKLRLLFNWRRLPGRSLSFLHFSSSVYASVRRAGDGYEDESHLSQLLASSLCYHRSLRRSHAWGVRPTNLPLPPPNQPQTFSPHSLCGGSGSVPFSVIDPFGPLRHIQHWVEQNRR